MLFLLQRSAVVLHVPRPELLALLYLREHALDRVQP
jgi:hypothetical protein